MHPFAGISLNVPDVFASIRVEEVKLLSRNNSVEGYLLVTNTEGSAREPMQDHRGCNSRHSSLSSQVASDGLSSLAESDETPCTDESSTPFVCSMSSRERSISQVCVCAKESMSQAAGELRPTLEPLVAGTARALNDGGSGSYNKVQRDGVSKGNRPLDGSCVGCCDDRGPSDSFVQASSCSHSCASFDDASNVDDMFSMRLQSSPSNAETLPPEVTSDSGEESCRETRSLDSVLCSKLMAKSSQKSCKFSKSKRNPSDPGKKPTIYIKMKNWCDVSRSFSEPNEASQ